MALSFAVCGRFGAAQPKINTTRSRAGLSHRIGGVLLALCLSGCVRYEPVPRPLSDTAGQFSARTVSWTAAAQTCKRLAPAAPCDPAGPDRLMLFAMLVENNPAVAAARAHLRNVEAAAAAARAPVGPTLTLSTEYARASADSSPWLFGIALDVPLDLGGRRTARVASADLAVTSVRYDLVEAVWTARMALVRALDEISIANRQRVLAGELVELQERRMQAVERRVMAGETSRAELERVRNDLADARRRETATVAMSETGKAQLASALGLPAANLPAGAMQDDAIAIATPASRPDARTRNQALLARGDLLKAMVAYSQAEVDLRGEITRQYPAISVGPGFTWERGLVKLPFNVGLVLPPLDFNRRNIRAAEARRSEAGAALEASYASAVGNVDVAYAEATAAERALADLSKLDRPIARRLAVQADREIASGAIDRSDWAAARAGLLIVRLAELDAMSRVLVANAALEDALRRPLSGPETLIEGPSR